MNKDILVSVVVPVYNVEKYLDECIGSLVSQTYRNLDIVLVDDGSKDSSGAICDSWKDKDERIRVFHKENEGLGLTRNFGIHRAKGDYVLFVDSDDYLSLDAIEKCVLEVLKNGSDSVLFGYEDFCEGTIYGNRVPDKYRVIKGDSVVKDFLPDIIDIDRKNSADHGYQMSACMVLMSLALIRENSLYFESEKRILAEDVYYLLKYYGFVRNLTILPEAFYHYRRNLSSVSRSYDNKRLEKIDYFYTEVIRLCDELGYGEEVKDRFCGVYVSFLIAALKSIARSDESISYKFSVLRGVCSNENVRHCVKKCDYKNESKGRKLFYWFVNRKLYIVLYFLLLLK